MALTGMQIYKSLPRTNCKDCGLPTCMAFAMQVASKQRALDNCPHISEGAKADLSDASAPPMKLVKIGVREKVYEFGQETVMFRHEEKFFRPCGIAVRIPDSLSDDDAVKKAEKINGSVFERVGKELKVSLCALEVEGCANPAVRARSIADKLNVPVILIARSADTMKAAVEAIADTRPLIYKADASNIDDFAALAAEKKLPLAIGGSSLDELEELCGKAKAKGVQEMVLAMDSSDPGETVRNLTITRRAALKKQFRIFGFPAIVDVSDDNPGQETLLAATFAAKYAGIIIINGVEPWELLPVLTTIQDVFTDPQVPNTVESKLYEIGSPDESSPVIFTTNFSLTYFSVASEVERSKISSYICVVDTEGLGVLNAYAGDKISAEKIIKTLVAQKVAEKVSHRKLIIPGLLPIFRAEIEDTSEWKEVIIGPESASKIPAFLTNTWK